MSEPTELSVERVIALALMHGMRHANGPDQAANVIATALGGAGWVMVRAGDVEFALIAMRVAKHEIEDLNVEAHFRAVTSGGYQ